MGSKTCCIFKQGYSKGTVAGATAINFEVHWLYFN